MPGNLQPSGAKWSLLLLGRHHSLKVGHRQTAVSAEAIADVFFCGPSAALHRQMVAYHLSRQLASGIPASSALRAAQLNHAWAAHSARAGWAVERRLEGMPFSELREIGCWRSDSALRTYLVISNTSYLTFVLDAARPVADWLMGDFQARFPWW